MAPARHERGGATEGGGRALYILPVVVVVGGGSGGGGGERVVNCDIVKTSAASLRVERHSAAARGLQRTSDMRE